MITFFFIMQCCNLIIAPTAAVAYSVLAVDKMLDGELGIALFVAAIVAMESMAFSLAVHAVFG